MIALCVTDGVLPFDQSRYSTTDPLEMNEGPLDIGNQLTASVAIKQLTEMLEMVRMMNAIGIGVQERLVSSLDLLCEMTQGELCLSGKCRQWPLLHRLPRFGLHSPPSEGANPRLPGGVPIRTEQSHPAATRA